MEDEYKRFGIKVGKIDPGLSFGVCISYDKVAFHRGTSNIAMRFKISNIQIIEDNPGWVEIKLGERL